ncbi:TPA: RICH domain-containing protein, partial [Streptococcus pneumoniae]
MFASKSERKVHYSIRKFSVGVASVVVASLFLGGVVHAEGVRSGDTPKVTSSGQDISKKYADEVKSHLEKILSEIQLDKRKHTQNLAFNKKLSRIQTEYFYLKKKLKAELTSKTKEELTSKTEELTSKTKKELDAAFEQFKKDTLSTEPEKKVAEAQKKVAEAKKKAEDQKEEDRRNYPTNTYKTLELEIAEFDVKVKEAELELLKEKAKESRDEEKIKQAEAEVESKQAEATRLENIKTDRKKAEEAKRKADAKLKEANVATSDQGKPKGRAKRGVPGELATPDKKENDAKSSDSSVGEETLPSSSLKSGKKVAEAEKKVEEAEKKAKDQKEEDRRNYPTNTYKTLELEIAESDVKVKEAELELVKEEAKEPRDEEKIKQAKAEVESKQAEATRLEKIKTDRKKAEEEAKRKAAEEDKVKEKPAEQPQPAPAPQP